MKNNTKILFCIICMFSTVLSFAQNGKGWKQEEAVLNQLQSAQSPADYVLSKTKEYDLVLIGEHHGVKNNLDLIMELIPRLYQEGVYNLCMEFGAVEMQSRLDSLLTADSYNEQLARDMFFYYNTGWAYKEYADIYKTVWALNKNLPAGSKKFRVINLSYRYDWSKFEGSRTPYVMEQIFYRGPVSKFRMQVMEDEILSKGEKAIALLGTPHVVTKYQMPSLRSNNDNFCDYDDQATGNRLYRKYPQRVFNILLHQPFNDKKGKGGYNHSPADGQLEAIMQVNNNKPAGFDLLNTPLGNLPDNSYYSTGYPNFRLMNLYDGYIFLKPFSQLEGCTIDTNFFAGKSWEEIKKQMPDPDWHGAVNSLTEYWKQIEGAVDLKKRYSGVIKSE